MDDAEGALRYIAQVIERLSKVSEAVTASPEDGAKVADDLGIDMSDVAVDPDELYATREEAMLMASKKEEGQAARAARKLGDGISEYVAGQ